MHVDHACICDDAIQGREFVKDSNRFLASVGGDHVEFGGLDNQLAGGDAGRAFTIDDEEARADHASILLLSKGRANSREQPDWHGDSEAQLLRARSLRVCRLLLPQKYLSGIGALQSIF
jgi:hypothetical protein